MTLIAVFLFKGKEKPAKSGKISFPGLKKNKKKSESPSSKDSREFTNPSYQQQLELSQYMNTLDSQQNADYNPNERVVVGSEAPAVNFDEEGQKSGTLSGIQIKNAVPVQKFSGETELDHATSSSTEVTGKTNKKKKLVFKVKNKFKKSNKDSTDGSDSHGNSHNKTVVTSPATSSSNLYTDFKATKETDSEKSPKRVVADYENINNFREHDSRHSAEVLYNNGQLVTNQVLQYQQEENEEIYENAENAPANNALKVQNTLDGDGENKEIYENVSANDALKLKAVGGTNNDEDIGVYEPLSPKHKQQRNRKWSAEEEHYKVPMKVISMEDLTTQEHNENEDDLENQEKDTVGNVEYQDARSKLKKVSVQERDINDKELDTSLGESYLAARSKLRSSNKSLSFSPRPSQNMSSDRNSTASPQTISEDSSSRGTPSSVSSPTPVREITSDAFKPETTELADDKKIGTATAITTETHRSPSTTPEEIEGENNSEGNDDTKNPFDDDFVIGEENNSVSSRYSSAQDLLDENNESLSHSNIENISSSQSTLHTETDAVSMEVDSSTQEDNGVHMTLEVDNTAIVETNNVDGVENDVKNVETEEQIVENEDKIVENEDLPMEDTSTSISMNEDVEQNDAADRMIVDSVVEKLKNEVIQKGMLLFLLHSLYPPSLPSFFLLILPSFIIPFLRLSSSFSLCFLPLLL